MPHRYAVVMQDFFSYLIQSYPNKNKSEKTRRKTLQQFLPSSKTSRNSFHRQFSGIESYLRRFTPESHPYRSETNGTAERVVRRVKEGTSSDLVQSGFFDGWWSEAMRCFCHLSNIQDSLADGPTPYVKRFNAPFGGPTWALWSRHAVQTHLAERQMSSSPVRQKKLTGIFMGCALHTRGGWTGDLRIADLDELEESVERHVRRKRVQVRILRSTHRHLAETTHVPMCRRIDQTGGTRRTSSPPPSKSSRRSGCGGETPTLNKDATNLSTIWEETPSHKIDVLRDVRRPNAKVQRRRTISGAYQAISVTVITLHFTVGCACPVHSEVN